MGNCAGCLGFGGKDKEEFNGSGSRVTSEVGVASSTVNLIRNAPSGSSNNGGRRISSLQRLRASFRPTVVPAQMGTEVVSRPNGDLTLGQLIPSEKASSSNRTDAVNIPSFFPHNSSLGGKAVIFEITDFYPSFKVQYDIKSDRSHVSNESRQLAAMLRDAGVVSLDIQQNSTTEEARDAIKKYAADVHLSKHSCFVCIVLTRGVLALLRTTSTDEDLLPFYDGYMLRSELVEPIRKSQHISNIPVLFVFEGSSSWLSSPVNLSNFSVIWPTQQRVS